MKERSCGAVVEGRKKVKIIHDDVDVEIGSVYGEEDRVRIEDER